MDCCRSAVELVPLKSSACQHKDLKIHSRSLRSLNLYTSLEEELINFSSVCLVLLPAVCEMWVCGQQLSDSRLSVHGGPPHSTV
jgi:hypothetical protein